MARSEYLQRLDRRWYPGVADNWDDELFRARILQRLNPDSQVLDLGAGAGIVAQMNFKNSVRRACGVDLDPRVVDNPYLHDAKVSSGERIPYGDAEFDVVFSDNVLEHLDHPAAVFAEVFRVLRPGGYFLAKTPNRWHYMPVIARMTPHSFHSFFNRLRGRATVDTFPTRYRANSPGQMRKLAAQTGFEVSSIELIESRPEYLRFNALAYYAGIAYERTVNSTNWLSAARILLVAEFRKPAAP